MNLTLVLQGTLTLLLAVFMALFLREKALREKNEEATLEKMEDGKNALLDAAHKADEILDEVKKESENASISLEKGKVVLEKEYKRLLDDSLNQASSSLDKEISETKAHYEAFVSHLEKQNLELENKINDFVKSSVESLLSRFEGNLKLIQDRAISSQEQSEEAMKAKVSELLIDFEQKMSSFLNDSQQKSMEAVGLEVKSARELIDSYKKQQLEIIDENVVAVLERTLNLVLRKRLSLKDHLDLVYDSLEKAKSDKFLI